MRTRLKRIYAEKLKNSNGETIVETLVSVLVISLALVMLAGSIVSSSRVNRKVRDAQTAFNADTIPSSGTVSLTHANDSTNIDTIDVTVHITNDNNSYVYYEKEN